MHSRNQNLYEVWDDVPEQPKDKILYFNQLFVQNKNPDKVNLTIGAYRDDEGKPWTLTSVQKALTRLNKNQQHGYLRPRGDDEFIRLALEVAYGRDNNLLAGTFKDTQVAAAQCLSGAGGLLLFFNMIKRFYQPLQKSGNQIWMPKPTWANHQNMAKIQGLKPMFYDYYDLKNRKFDYPAFIRSLKQVPEESVVIFHPVGHNPTGFDPSSEQWKEIMQIAKQRKFLNCFDMAYQGFVSGNLAKDAYSVRLFAQNKLPMVVIQSFAKNFGLYGQRIGCISIPNVDEKWVKNMNEMFGFVIRRLYSNNPRFGSDIVKTVLNDSELRRQWDKDIEHMSSRMIRMRKRLYEELKKTNSNDDWSYVLQQQGMFAFTHITKEQVVTLRDKHAIFMLESGRISVCGLTEKNVSYVAKCIAEVTKNNQ